jgi:hypothetical protein
MKRLLMLIPFMCCLGCQQGNEVVEQPAFSQTEEERINLKTLQLWTEEVWENGKLELVKELVASKYIRHTPTGDQVYTPEQYAEVIRKHREDMSNANTAFKSHAVSAKDDLIWMRWSVVSTDANAVNEGAYRALQVYRFVDGNLAETWWARTDDQGPWPDFER